MLSNEGKQPLSVTHPELAKEAVGWNPDIYLPTNSRQFWLCAVGHQFESVIAERKRGKGCPYCAGKKVLKGFNDLETTHPDLASEAHNWDPTLYSAGSHDKVDWKCERGHITNSTIKNRALLGNQCRICKNQEVLVGFNDLASFHPDIAKEANGWDPEKVISGSNIKYEWKCAFGHLYKASPGARTRGQGCTVCLGKQILIGFNDLQTTHPDIAKEADGWNPLQYNAGSNKKKSWRCHLGHQWKTTILNRTFSNTGCPYCSNKKVWIGFNDLQTTHPEIAAEASGWNPTSITYGSSKKKRWKCKNGHIWTSSPTVRTAKTGSGCPTCSATGFNPNADGYLYFIEHCRWGMLQIGITNYPDNRLKDHKSLGWELLEIRGPMDGHLTQQWETAILRMLKAKGADLSNSTIAGKFDGFSEAWSKLTFEVKSIKQLMELTEQFEESLKKK